MHDSYSIKGQRNVGRQYSCYDYDDEISVIVGRRGQINSAKVLLDEFIRAQVKIHKHDESFSVAYDRYSDCAVYRKFNCTTESVTRGEVGYKDNNRDLMLVKERVQLVLQLLIDIDKKMLELSRQEEAVKPEDQLNAMKDLVNQAIEDNKKLDVDSLKRNPNAHHNHQYGSFFGSGIFFQSQAAIAMHKCAEQLQQVLDQREAVTQTIGDLDQQAHDQLTQKVA